MRDELSNWNLVEKIYKLLLFEQSRAISRANSNFEPKVFYVTLLFGIVETT
jgi:hypothetical protein